jgi:hypothetical protein
MEDVEVEDRRGHHKVKLREIPVSRTQKSHWAKPSGSKSNPSESMTSTTSPPEYNESIQRTYTRKPRETKVCSINFFK